MGKRKQIGLSFLILMDFAVSLWAEVELTSATHCINQMVLAAKTHWETPLLAKYKEERTFFYPASYIKEQLPDGKVKIMLTGVKLKSSSLLTGEVTETAGELVCAVHQEYGLPYITELAEIDHYLWKGKYYIEKRPSKKNVRNVYIYDGKDTRKITSPFENQPAEKWVEIYENQEFYLFGKLILSMPYPYYEITPQFPTTPQISCDGNHYKIQTVTDTDDISMHISADEGFMRCKVTGYNSGKKVMEMNIYRSVKLNDLYLPVELERKEYNPDGTPKIFVRLREITWKVKTPEDIERQLNTPNPENARVIYPLISSTKQ